MKILFISHCFPPWNSIGAVRTGKTAKYLIKHGHDVRVISCNNQTLDDNLTLEIPREKVQYTSWMNVNKPIELLLGGGGISTKSFNLSSDYLSNCIYSAGTFYKNVLNFPDGQIGWFPFAQHAGLRLIRQWIPDIIFASGGPFTSLLVASSISKKCKIPWVAELRDLWVDNYDWVRPFWRYGIEKKLEHSTLTSASGLVTVSEPMAENLKSKYFNPCKVITNGFDQEDYLNLPKIPFSKGIVRIAYTGQIYNKQQDPSPLFIALQQMGKEREKIRVDFYGRNLEIARKKMALFNINRLVKFHDSVSHKNSISIQTQSDILLLFPGHGSSWKGIYTGKLFEYLGARRPILNIGNSEGVAANLIRKCGAGVSLSEPGLIAQKLNQWIKQKSDKGEIPPLPLSVGEGYTREEQTEKLSRFLHSCLENPDST